MSQSPEQLVERSKHVLNAGISKCPICGRTWLVTPYDDCMIPACGCYGKDSSAENPNRPCEKCGMDHARNCKLIPSKKGKINDV